MRFGVCVSMVLAVCACRQEQVSPPQQTVDQKKASSQELRESPLTLPPRTEVIYDAEGHQIGRRLNDIDGKVLREFRKTDSGTTEKKFEYDADRNLDHIIHRDEAGRETKEIMVYDNAGKLLHHLLEHPDGTVEHLTE